MAAKSTPAAALFVLAALLALLLVPPCAAATPSCSTVYTTLMPCLGYVESGGTVPAPCCAGIKQLVSSFPSPSDLRAMCACVKSLAKNAPAADIDRAVGLPGKCGVNADCN